MMKFGIIGFGGLGKVHFGDLAEIKEKAGDVELVAICDIDESRFTAKTNTNLGEDTSTLDLSAYNLYTDIDEMLDKEELDFVITALPTFIHEQVAVKVMNKGINVFSEKPMALTLEQAQNMIDASEKNNVKLMIGQCLRYWPEYKILKEAIDTNKYGKVLFASFRRLSPLPKWSWEDWFLDETRSGGAALDLHVHDVDFINWAFGKPKAVTSKVINEKTKHDTVITSYDYDDKIVTCIGTWGLPEKAPFSAEYYVRFENAVLDAKGGVLSVYTDEVNEKIEFAPENAYTNEVVDFIDCIRTNRKSTINPPESSKISVEIALAEKLSGDTKKKVEL